MLSLLAASPLPQPLMRACSGQGAHVTGPFRPVISTIFRCVSHYAVYKTLHALSPPIATWYALGTSRSIWYTAPYAPGTSHEPFTLCRSPISHLQCIQCACLNSTYMCTYGGNWICSLMEHWKCGSGLGTWLPDLHTEAKVVKHKLCRCNCMQSLSIWLAKPCMHRVLHAFMLFKCTHRTCTWTLYTWKLAGCVFTVLV